MNAGFKQRINNVMEQQKTKKSELYPHEIIECKKLEKLFISNVS